jgi:hypothetical protein
VPPSKAKLARTAWQARNALTKNATSLVTKLVKNVAEVKKKTAKRNGDIALRGW